MSKPRVIVSSDGRRFKVGGRREPKHPQPKLLASKFIDLSGFVVPDTTNYRAAASASLRNVYLNDQLGDCVPAGCNHVAGSATANAGSPWVPTAQNVESDYEAIGGFDPSDPEETDNGCDEDTAFAYYHSHGWANGTKAAGTLAIDATNYELVRACVYLFENVVFGVGLPEDWISPFPSADGFVWDAAGPAVPDNGHCLVAVDLASNGLVVDSWGLYGVTTQAAIAKYAVRGAGGQLTALLTPDMVNRAIAKAPNGMAWADLVGAFGKFGGHVAPIALP